MRIMKLIPESNSTNKPLSKLNEANLITLDDISDAQSIAAKSKLNYEDSWDAITAYLISTMGLPKAMALVLKLEKDHTKLYR